MRQDTEKSLSFATTCFKHIRPPNFHGSGKLDWKHPLGGIFSATFSVRLDLPTGTFILSYHWNNPSAPEDISDVISLTGRLHYLGYARWYFLCPRKGPKCLRRCSRLYMGDSKYFGCMNCADVQTRQFRQHNAKVDWLVKHPNQIKATLNSPLSTPKNREHAWEALQILYGRLRRLRKKRNSLRLSLKRRGAKRTEAHRSILFPKLGSTPT